MLYAGLLDKEQHRRLLINPGGGDPEEKGLLPRRQPVPTRNR